MAKLTLTDLSTTLSNTAASVINNNNTALEAALENTLSRDGSTPNTMEADFDMNSHRILNLLDALNDQEPATYAQLQASVTTLNDRIDLIMGGGGTVVSFNGRVGAITPVVGDYSSFYALTSHTQTASTITDFSEAVDDRVAALLVAGSGITLTYNDVANTLTVASSGGGTGDVVGPASSTDSELPLFSSTTGKLLKNSSTVVTAAGLALLDDASNTAQRTTLGLGSLATLSTITATEITGSTITYAKIQNVTASRLLGNPTGSAAAPSEISLGATLAFSGTALQTAAHTGDVTTAANSFATTIANNAVTYAKFQQVAASSLVGNATGALANATGITLGATLTFSAAVLQTAAMTGHVTSSANSFATTIASSVITYAMLASATVMTAAEFRSNTASKVMSPTTFWSALDLVTLTDGATVTPDLSTGINFTWTIGGARTLAAPTNTKNGQNGVIYLVQDATGSRTITWNSVYKFQNATAPTLSTAANAVDRITYFVRSSTHIDIDFSKGRG